MKAPKDSVLKRLQKEHNKEGLCSRCNRSGYLTIDHIIPAHLLEQLGLHEEAINDEENFEIICYTCNKFKGARLDMANPQTAVLLKKYVARLWTPVRNATPEKDSRYCVVTALESYIGLCWRLSLTRRRCRHVVGKWG